MTQLQAYNLLTAAMQNRTYQPHAPFAALSIPSPTKTEKQTPDGVTK